MMQITYKNTPVSISGDIISEGKKIPEFTLTSPSLKKVTLQDLTRQFSGQKKILNVVPSFDTSVCSMSAKKFDALTARDTITIGISRDTPMAQKRFCEITKIVHSSLLSDITHSFGPLFGLNMVDGPLEGLLARAVIVLDENNIVIHSQLVPEITQEPNYDVIISAIQ